MSIQVFCPFLDWVVSFFACWVVRRVLYIFWILTPDPIYDLQQLGNFDWELIANHSHSIIGVCIWRSWNASWQVIWKNFFDLWIHARHFPYSLSEKTHNNPVRYARSLSFYRWRDWGSERSNNLLKVLQPSKWHQREVKPCLPASAHLLGLRAARESVQASFTHVLLITLVLWISLKKPLCLASKPPPAPLTLQNVIPPYIWISAWLKYLVFLYPVFTGRADTLAFPIYCLHCPASSLGLLRAAHTH